MVDCAFFVSCGCLDVMVSVSERDVWLMDLEGTMAISKSHSYIGGHRLM